MSREAKPRFACGVIFTVAFFAGGLSLSTTDPFPTFTRAGLSTTENRHFHQIAGGFTCGTSHFSGPRTAGRYSRFARGIVTDSSANGFCGLRCLLNNFFSHTFYSRPMPLRSPRVSYFLSVSCGWNSPRRICTAEFNENGICCNVETWRKNIIQNQLLLEYH